MKPSGTRVLIVEDEAIVAMDLQRRVEQLGYQVVGTAASGERAIHQAETFRPDLILMDIHLQGEMDGVTAAEHIRRICEAPVVFLTAFSDATTVQRATATEPFGYILKPVDDRELEIAIAVALYRRHAEEGVRRMERWLATTLTSIGDAVMTTDLDGRLAFMNTAAQGLTGWAVDDGRSRHLNEILTLLDEDSQSSIDPVARVLSEGMIVGLSPRTSIVGGTGERVAVDVSGAPIRDENDAITGVVLVIRDVTVQRKLAGELRQSQKLEAVGRLAGGVAHAFNNQMTIVLGVSELVLNDERLPGDLRDALDDLRRAAERAASLTGQLLAFGRKQVFRPQVVDVNVVIAEILPVLTRALGDLVTVQTRLAGTDAAIWADKAQIGQVIIDLAANGREAMPSGGILTISTRREGSSVLLEVTDTGIGMTRDVMDHIFEPFFTTKPVGQGTGLALAAVHGTVALADGRIEVESTPGAGSTFRLRFPIPNPPGHPQAPPDMATASPHPAGQTVLVVDDEPSVRRLITRVLRLDGFTVLEADDAPQALDILNEHKGAVDLIIANLIMPSGSGAALARRIAADHPDMKSLLMSGYPEGNTVPGNAKVGSLQKPFGRAELLDRVRALLPPGDAAREAVSTSASRTT